MKISTVVLSINEMLILQRGHAIQVRLPDAQLFITLDPQMIELFTRLQESIKEQKIASELPEGSKSN